MKTTAEVLASMNRKAKAIAAELKQPTCRKCQKARARIRRAANMGKRTIVKP